MEREIIVVDYNLFRFRLQWWWNLAPEYTVTSELENFVGDFASLSEEVREQLLDGERTLEDPIDYDHRRIFANEDESPIQTTFDEVVDLIYQAVLASKTSGQPFLLKASEIGLAVFFKNPPKIVEADQKEVVIVYQGKRTTKRVEDTTCHHFPGFNVDSVDDLDQLMDVLEVMGPKHSLSLMYLHMPNSAAYQGVGIEVNLGTDGDPQPGEEVYFKVQTELARFNSESQIRSELTEIFERVIQELTGPCLTEPSSP